MRKIRIMVVDDAVVVRTILTRLFADEPGFEVVGSAASGRIALGMLAQQSQPVDIIVLDVDMPDMNGMEALAVLRRQYPEVAVLMFSGLTEAGAQITLDALALGAVDYLTKPAQIGSVPAVLQHLREELIPKVRAIAGRRLRREEPTRVTSRPPVFTAARGPVDLLAIGASTGGPSALGTLLPMFPRDLPVPIVIVQHMPPIFTKLLGERLGSKCALRVSEAREGDPLVPGQVLIAPGNFHMVVTRSDGAPRVRLHQGPPENSCRPAVDVLFRSVTEVYGGRVLAVVLTGMGQDGTAGCEVIRRAGGQVLAQDEESSVVWGMPRFVITSGLADKVLPLDQMAPEMLRRVMESRGGFRREFERATL